MIQSEPRRQKGQVAISRSNTRPRSLAQFQSSGAVRPWSVKGIHEVSVGILFKPLKRYGTSSCIANQTLQLITPMGWDLRVGVQGKSVHTGTAGSFEFRPFLFIATTRADAAYFLASPFPKGDALRDRGRHGAGEFGCVVEQRIIASSHGSLNSRLQVSQLA